MKRHHILFMRVNAVEDRTEIVKRVVVADHHQDISGTHPQSLGCEIVTGLEIELIQFRVLGGAFPGSFFRHRKNREEDQGEGHAGNRRHLLREEIDEILGKEKPGLDGKAAEEDAPTSGVVRA